jgi:hypothetical protein
VVAKRLDSVYRSGVRKRMSGKRRRARIGWDDNDSEHMVRVGPGNGCEEGTGGLGPEPVLHLIEALKQAIGAQGSIGNTSGGFGCWVKSKSLTRSPAIRLSRDIRPRVGAAVAGRIESLTAEKTRPR